MYGLLQQAKIDCLQQKEDAIALRAELKAERDEKEELARVAESNRTMYSEMFKEDRRNYSEKIREMEAQNKKLEQEKREALQWAKEKQQEFLRETNDLQAQLAAAKKEGIAYKCVSVCAFVLLVSIL